MRRTRAARTRARFRLDGRRRKIALAVVGGSLLFGLVAWYVVIPYPWTLRSRNPDRTSVMEQRLREADKAGAPVDIRQQWVSLDDISPWLVRAVIVAEDYRFREHEGIDWVSLAEEVDWSGDESFSWLSASDVRALSRALAYTWSNRGDMRGRSTITQQLAKNLYFGTDRSFLRKAMEFVVARRLEKRLGKDRILEIYLNVAEWGPGIFGVEMAARTYFGRSAATLTLDEAAALAATLPHPLTSNPARTPSRMLWRKELILGRIQPGSPIAPAPLPFPEPELGMDDSASGVDPASPDVPSIDPAQPDTGAAVLDTLRDRPDTCCAGLSLRGWN